MTSLQFDIFDRKVRAHIWTEHDDSDDEPSHKILLVENVATWKPWRYCSMCGCRMTIQSENGYVEGEQGTEQDLCTACTAKRIRGSG